QHGDIAMYAAKAELGNGYSVYTPEQDRHGADRLGQLAELRRAIEGDELFLEYQPLVSLRTGRVTSVEALVRWEHPTRGRIMPNAFIPLAEQTGLIKPLTERVIGMALHDVGQWRARHHDCPVAVNLSTRNLLDPLLPDLVRELLLRHDVPPAALRFEITESVLLGEPERAMRGPASSRSAATSSRGSTSPGRCRSRTSSAGSTCCARRPAPSPASSVELALGGRLALRAEVHVIQSLAPPHEDGPTARARF